MRKKSINLILLIFIILLIIVLIITSVYLINHSNNDSEKDDESTSSKENTSHVELQLTNVTSENNEIQATNTNSILNSLNNFEDIGNTENANNISENSTLILNNHIYSFDNSVEASVVENSSNKQELQIKYLNYNFQISLNTDSSMTFEDLKNNSSLKDYLESNCNINITSSLKSGTLENLNIIICTISDNKGQAYFIVTPLNNSEIAYIKIYNTDDNQILIDDLSDPIDQISSIISNVK